MHSGSGGGSSSTTATSSSPGITIDGLRSQRRRKRKRSTTATNASSGSCGGCCSLLGTIIAVCGSLSLIYLHISQQQQQTGQQRPSLLLFPPNSNNKNVLAPSHFGTFPDDRIDLWPYHRNRNNRGRINMDERFRTRMLQNCWPSENVECRERKIGNSQHVAIVRTPGILGTLFERYLVSYIEHSRTDDMDMVVKVSPAVEMIRDYTLTQILRPAIQPILLEAIDLLLLTTGSDYPANATTDKDLVGVVRLLTRWHCHLSAISTDTALLTIPLDEMMAFPMKTGKDLSKFLGLHSPDQDHVELGMDEYAQIVFDRIDACTRYIQMLSTVTSSERILGATLYAIRAEMESGKCDTKRIVPDEFIPTSRVTELVSSYLGDGSYVKMCQKYPKAQLCITDN